MVENFQYVIARPLLTAITDARRNLIRITRSHVEST
jgi:hypothetical protein